MAFFSRMWASDTPEFTARNKELDKVRAESEARIDAETQRANEVIVEVYQRSKVMETMADAMRMMARHDK